MGFLEINEEQKIRIALSNRAIITMTDDMDIFSITKPATFINSVFKNYRNDAKSSISLYLQQRELELNQLFSNTKLDDIAKKIAIDQILSNEKKYIIEEINQYKNSKATSKLYHINNENIKYLVEDCNEDNFFKRPGQYIKSVIEEYCSLPFIKRERIFRKQIYEKVELACKEKRILKITADYYGKNQLFYVYPYKIESDSLDTQSYLVCYSRKAEENEKDKILASFSMARLNMPTLLSKSHFHLTKQETTLIENAIVKYSPAYLVGKPEQIHVRLTKKGKQSYQTRLYSRPEKIIPLSTDEEYVFNCTPQQIYNYFFPFGADAEIISPEYLRNKIYKVHTKALEAYDNK